MRLATMTDHAEQLAHGIAGEFRRRLLTEYLPRIATCCERLGEARIWQRPGDNGNSVGNLILHLAGNTTQWILSPFGELEDHRDRDGEFAARSGQTSTELLSLLGDVFQRACEIVEEVSVDQLLAPRIVQGFHETGLSVILHVLEHCSGHAGQIYSWTKQVTGEDLRFYDL